MTAVALHTRLSASVWRLASRLPARWRSSARRRRLLFLALCSPGFIGIAALPAHRNIWVLLASLASMAVALAFRRLSEPAFLAQTGDSHA
jgi:hypothetical protein